MKRAKLIAGLLSCMMCLAMLTIGVWAVASVATLDINGNLKFYPEGLFVQLSGEVYRGNSSTESEMTKLADPRFNYGPVANFDNTQDELSGNFPLEAWEMGSVAFIPNQRFIKIKVYITNYSDFAITGTPTVTIGGQDISKTITGLTVTSNTSELSSITSNTTATYELILEATGSTEFSKSLNVSFEFTEVFDVTLSGTQYSGATHAVLTPTGSGSFTSGTAITDSSSTVNWDNLQANLTTTERAVKYRMEVTNTTEAGISGTGAFTIVGQTNPTPTTAGGVNTYTFADYTVTEYAQYIQNIQPNDTQVYELVVELNQSADNATINVSISFDFTDETTYSITWNSNTYNYVNMGHYPQRYVGNTMNAELEGWYTSLTQTEKENPISTYTAYKGYTSSGGTCNKNNPVVYNAYNYIDGNTYVRMETPDFYQTSCTYMNGEKVTNQASWYKVEPIQWRVLNPTEIETENAVLLSELALSANTTYYYDYTAAINQSTSGYAGYKSSTIREFLTNSFYNEALTSEEQAKVTERTLTDRELDPKGVITADTSVTDKVWLPTYNDYNSTYFSSSTQRLCSPSDFALANYSYLDTDGSRTTAARQNGGTVNYWISSASSASNRAYNVYINGVVINYPVSNESIAARPALLFKI